MTPSAISPHHPEIFVGCTEAISEVGGYSITLPRQDTGEEVRAYLLQTAEKGYAWLKGSVGESRTVRLGLSPPGIRSINGT